MKTRRRLIPRLALLMLLVTTAAGCLHVSGSVPPCSTVFSSPGKVSVGFFGQPYYNRWARSEVRHMSWLQLAELPGLHLLFYKPNLRNMYCTRVSEKRREAWLASTEILLKEPARIEVLGWLRPEVGEAIAIAPRGGAFPIAIGEGFAVAVEDLTPQGLEAARAVSCLAVGDLGSRARRALLASTPGLMDRIGFPASCAESSSKPVDDLKEI